MVSNEMVDDATMTAISTLAAITNDNDLFELFYKKSAELSPVIAGEKETLREMLRLNYAVLRVVYNDKLEQMRKELEG